MRIDLLSWEKYWSYLQVVKNYKNSKSNLYSVKSRFYQVKAYFAGKDFNQENVISFLTSKKTGSKSNYNKLITTLKNIGTVIGADSGITKIRYETELINPQVVLSVEEIDALANIKIDYGKKSDFINARQKTLILFMGRNGGCRGGEAFKLEWTDLFKEDIPYVILRDTKNGRNRKVTLAPSTYELINSLPKISKYIFSTYRGGQLHCQQINLDLKKRALKCGINKKISCHTFRRSYITNRTNDPFLNPTNLAVVTGQSLEVIMRYKQESLEENFSTIMSHPAFKKEVSNEDNFNKIQSFIDQTIDSGKLNCKITKRNGEFLVKLTPVKS